MINQDLLNRFDERFASQPINHASKHAIAKVGINPASFNHELLAHHPTVFSHETKYGKITDQKASGRCWMFAGLNTIRVNTMEKLNLEHFEFSQNYSLFWDKLERSQFVLEALIDTIDQPLESRLVWHLLQDPLQDGGQWEMFAGILDKYGAVPKDIMPETYHSSNTRDLNEILNDKLRESAARMRQIHQAGQGKDALQAEKENTLAFIYNVLIKALGRPPKVFDYSYRDQDGKAHKIKQISPQDFFNRYGAIDVSEMVSLIHAPTQDKAFGKTYTVNYLGSIVEAQPIKYLNVPIDVLKQAAIASIQDGQPVWFGCDVGKMTDRKTGIMDDDIYAYADTLGQKITLTKEERLNYSSSMLTHAMVFVGVDLDDSGQPLYWKVENSWGKDTGREGYYSMSDSWFDEYNYQITVPKKYVAEKWVKLYDQDPVALDPWDPMGALAFHQ